MSQVSDKRSTLSNAQGEHILQSSHFPVPAFRLPVSVTCPPPSVRFWSQSRPLGLPRQGRV